MANCLVTGGAGFIGSHIVDALVQRGDNVRVLDNLSTGCRHNLEQVAEKVEFVEGDIRDDITVKQAIDGIDFIFHLAAMVSVPESMEKPVEAELVNAIGTLNILRAAKAAGVQRLVLSSTSAVYGDEPTLPKVESMQPFPKSPYAISKLAAEHYYQLFNEAMHQETVILRYFNVFGPRQDPSSAYSGVISIFVDRLIEGTAPLIFDDGEQTRDFVYVKDVVQANLLAAQSAHASGKVFNIATGRPITINHLYYTLCGIVGSRLEPTYKPARSGDIRYSYGDATHAHKHLGWSAQTELEVGLAALVESIN